MTGQGCTVTPVMDLNQAQTGANIQCGGKSTVISNGAGCSIQDTADGADVRCGSTTVPIKDGAPGTNGKDGTSCVIASTASGADVTCADPASPGATKTVSIANGSPGPQGDSCSVTSDNATGGATITCGQGNTATTATVAGCVLRTTGNGSTEIVCNGNTASLPAGPSTVDPPCVDLGNRFCDNGNGSVHDQLTGLVWIKQTYCSPFLIPFDVVRFQGGVGGNHHQWKEKANVIQHGVCGLTDNSRPGDWRAPTLAEIKTLMPPPTICANSSLEIWNMAGTGCSTTTTIESSVKFPDDPNNNAALAVDVTEQGFEVLAAWQSMPTSDIDPVNPTRSLSIDLSDRYEGGRERTSSHGIMWAVRNV